MKQIKDSIEFIFQFINKPKLIGAILPSSKYLTKKILSFTDFSQDNLIIVEYGPGTGPFTEGIVKKLKQCGKLILIEQNEKFVKKLSVKYANRENVFIYQESVANVFNILDNHNISKADYIISGIPFSSIPKDITEKILENTKEIMSDESMFITFQYSMFKIKTFQKHFKILRKKFTLFNVPSAYVICMKKKDNL